MPNVRELMTPAPASVSRDASLKEVAEIMRDQAVGAVPVVGDDERPIGLITDRDIVLRVVADGGDPASTTAGDAASGSPVTVSGDDEALDAVRQIRAANVRRVLVVDDDRLTGIISLGDLAAVLDDGSALGEISATPPNN